MISNKPSSLTVIHKTVCSGVLRILKSSVVFLRCSFIGYPFWTAYPHFKVCCAEFGPIHKTPPLFSYLVQSKLINFSWLFFLSSCYLHYNKFCTSYKIPPLFQSFLEHNFVNIFNKFFESSLHIYVLCLLICHNTYLWKYLLIPKKLSLWHKSQKG